MSETVLASLISALAAILVCMVNNWFQQSAQRKQADKTTALITYRLEELEKKVGKHNEVIERTYKLEQHEAVVDEQIKVANHRIEDLEQAGK
ncbi:MAG: hemolysin XhlA family protein [Clostridiales bacterium]|nr:hemolysin XhlA family protein [Clostridiales bacterium]